MRCRRSNWRCSWRIGAGEPGKHDHRAPPEAVPEMSGLNAFSLDAFGPYADLGADLSADPLAMGGAAGGESGAAGAD